MAKEKGLGNNQLIIISDLKSSQMKLR